jgi:hypothetical protein
LYKAVLTPPICKGPVGLGAKRTRTLDSIFEFFLISKDSFKKRELKLQMDKKTLEISTSSFLYKQQSFLTANFFVSLLKSFIFISHL